MVSKSSGFIDSPHLKFGNAITAITIHPVKTMNVMWKLRLPLIKA